MLKLTRGAQVVLRQKDIFDKDWNSMQFTSELPSLLFRVAIFRYGQSVLIDLAHCINVGVYLVDSLEISLFGLTRSTPDAGIRISYLYKIMACD